MTPSQAESRGLFWVLGAFVICPCHLPLTLWAIAALLSGTAAGALFHAHVYMAGAAISGIWLAATWRGVRYFRAASRLCEPATLHKSRTLKEALMPRNGRALIIAVSFVAASAPARAQQPVDPAGHWQGAVQTPSMQVPFDLDLVKDAAGRFSGTLSVPAQKIKGLPLTKVAVDGATLNFQARSDQPFTGVLSEDRQSITGEFLISGNSLPFTLARNGAAQIEAPRKSAALSKQLEGTWTATLIVEGTPHQLVMTLVNHPDGSASGRIINEGEGGLELPIAIAEQGSIVTIETLPLASTLTATLNADGTELDGTIAQGLATARVTFRRSR